MEYEQETSAGDDRQTIRRTDEGELPNGSQLAGSQPRPRRRAQAFAGGRVLGDSRHGSQDGASKAGAGSESKGTDQSVMLNPRLWPSVEYGQRGSLPALAGVYCVMSGGGNLLYIGQSLNICQRWKGHHLQRQFKAGASLHIAYRETFSEAGRLKMEAILIRRHQPRWNVNLLPRWSKVGAIATPQARAMSEELTTADVAERLKRPERTVRLWCKQGLLAGARAVTTPRGDYWMIPATALKDFAPPTLGRRPRPPKSSPGTKKRATGAARASSGTATGVEKGRKK